MRRFFTVFGLIGLLVIIYAYQFYVGSLRYSLDSSSEARVVVQVNQGDTAGVVASKLKEERLIKSELVFRTYMNQRGMAEKIKAGRTVIQENFDMGQIADALVEGGKGAEVAITLLEGWTARQIGEKLENEGLTTEDDFMACVETCDFDYDFLPGYVEGYLYPDTYFVDSSAYGDKAFMSRLIGTFEAKLSEEDWVAIENSEHSLEEIVTMASIVEREERNPDERATVAGVLWNRFDAGIGLGADATVLYALGRTSGGLTYNDLQIDSPYNTRKYRGLPPAPISNPNISSIRAALYPEETDYWYYLHDPEGGIHYGRTLEEHNENKARYL